MRAGLHEQKDLVFFKDRKQVERAIDAILHGKFSDATANVCTLWEFIWLDVLPKLYNCAKGKDEDNLWNAKFKGDISIATLTDKVDVSDEALILSILYVRQEMHIDVEEEDTTSSDSNASIANSSISTEVSNSKTYKRKAAATTVQKKRGRTGF